MRIPLRINGREHSLESPSTHKTLSRALRSIGLTGTKEGCAEGDCGACTVLMKEACARTGATRLRAINSCIALLPMFADREIWTVEGLRKGPRLHVVQECMVKHYGSQCGYCTPGFVVSMAEAYYRNDLEADDTAAITDHLQGNLCRCTGYRPIRDAMSEALRLRPSLDNDALSDELARPVPELCALEASSERGERFSRPTSLRDLLQLRARFPEATLVAGATEVGVEINKKFRHLPHLVSTEGVAELRQVERTSDGWRFGGGSTLTDLDEALGDELHSLRKMIRVFASRQIRHRATVAGNLVTASPIGDLAPVFLSFDAIVTLASLDDGGHVVTRDLALSEFFTAYRKTAMRADEILLHVLLPHAPAGVTRVSNSYKVSKRRELDISIVAAAFSVDVDTNGLIVRARLAYGGVGPTSARAFDAETALVGKTFGPELARDTAALLGSTFKPLSDVRSGEAFRAALVTSLFQKFVLGESSEAQDGELTNTIDAAWKSDDASRALQHESGALHVSGEAMYVDDEAERRGSMLELWPVVSPHARARVLRRDGTNARLLAGVRAVLFAEDVPGENDVGAVRKDEPLFAKDEALYAGHIVAIVVAETLEAAKEAARLVEVEYEPLDAITTIAAAVAQNSYHTNESRIARGDFDAAFARAPRTLEGRSQIGGQEHFYLESQAAWAELDDSDNLIVHSSTQHPSEIQAVVAHVLHISRNRVVVESPRMGGGFGGKETQGNAWAAIVALAALRTKRPCRVQLDRDVDMMLTGKRHPFEAAYRVGFDDEGRILALRAHLVSDGGFALDLSESILDRALFHVDNTYFIPNIEVTGRVAMTNLASNTAFRGFGGPQGMLVIEDVIDRIARTLDLPSHEVRARNFYADDGEHAVTHYGQLIERNRIRPIWSRLLESSNFVARRDEIRAHNESSPWVKRGIAITPVKFGISFTATFLNQAGALVLIYRDGTVQVNHGGTEMGQGLYTKIRGIAMRELGLSAERVRVMKTRTDKVPNTSATAASAGADLNGAAVRNACTTLRERLVPVAEAMFRELGAVSANAPLGEEELEFAGDAVTLRSKRNASIPFDALVERAYFAQVSLAVSGYYRTPGIHYDKAKGRGKPFYYFAFGAAVSEVEVDALSGMKRVRRVDIVHDVGESLNPSVDRGQIEGGFVQGMGWLTGEELKWDAKGKLLSHSASTYAIPSIGDTPGDFRVELLCDAHEPGPIHGSKAVGEPPLMLALSVREAIRDAIAAFGPNGAEVIVPSPLSHEAIFHAIAKVQAQAASAD